MSRFISKKEEEMLQKLKEQEEVNMDDVIEVDDSNSQYPIEEHLSSIIVRILNTDALKSPGVVEALPSIWEMEGRVRGRGVGNNCIQFIFHSDEDMAKVLKKAPWFVNGWLVTCEQWTPNPPPEFLNFIPFWVKIKGIPLHLISQEAVDSIGSALGRVESVELHAKNSESLEYVRARVWLPVDEPLVFKRAVRFKKTGEVRTVELDYEKLIKLCFKCKRITHDQYHCRSKYLKEIQTSQKLQGSVEPSNKKGFSSFKPCQASQKVEFKFNASTSSKEKEQSQEVAGLQETSIPGGRGRGRGKTQTSRGRGRGRGRSSTQPRVIGEGSGESVEQAVFSRLGNTTLKGKGKAKEPEWRIKEVRQAPPNSSECDDKISRRLSSGKKVSGDGTKETSKLREDSHRQESSESLISSVKKRKSSHEKERAKKKMKVGISSQSPSNSQRLLSEGSSNSVKNDDSGHLDQNPEMFTLSSGVQVSVNPKTPIQSRFVVNLKPPRSI